MRLIGWYRKKVPFIGPIFWPKPLPAAKVQQIFDMCKKKVPFSDTTL